MLPAGPLMVEHRLIERMIKLLDDALSKLEDKGDADTDFIEKAVDFLRTYADRCHHGKEEDILFEELLKKDMSEEHKKIMDGLIEDHKFARKTTGELIKANEGYRKGDKDSLGIMVDSLKKLTDLYPRHIETEDKHFFMPVMDYFTGEEKEKMLNEFRDFDEQMIHSKYKDLVELYEAA